MVAERKFVTKISVRYEDPSWRGQQAIWMFTRRIIIIRIEFHVFEID